MKYTTTLLAAIAATTVSARFHSQEHVVVVGGPDLLRYTPDEVHARPGDTIKFVFQEKNHTLTESTFNRPCKKLMGGLDTGFVANLENITPGPEHIVQVTNRAARYFYCRQATHCGKGMVFALNSRRGIDRFRQRAIDQNGGDVAPPPPAPSQPAAGGAGDLFSQITDLFDTTGAAGLDVDYRSNGVGAEGKGADLTAVDTSKVPRFSLCGSCGNSPASKSIIAMLDVDAAQPRLMYLRKDFQSNRVDLPEFPDARAEDLISTTPPFVKYVGPETTVSDDGKPVHRYVFLQISQPRGEEFEFDADSVNVENFDLAAFYAKNDLKPTNSGFFFSATVGA